MNFKGVFFLAVLMDQNVDYVTLVVLVGMWIGHIAAGPPMVTPCCLQQCSFPTSTSYFTHSLCADEQSGMPWASTKHGTWLQPSTACPQLGVLRTLSFGGQPPSTAAFPRFNNREKSRHHQRCFPGSLLIWWLIFLFICCRC